MKIYWVKILTAVAGGSTGAYSERSEVLYSDSIEVCMASLRVSKTSFLVGTRTLALSTGASVSDIRGLQIYSLAGLDSPCWSTFA